MNILTASHLFTFVREGMMHAEFNSITLFTILYSRFQHWAKDVSKVTAQRTILELRILHGNSSCSTNVNVSTDTTVEKITLSRPLNHLTEDFVC